MTGKPRKIDWEATYTSRRKKILKAIRGEAALFVACPEKLESRDTHFPYRADSNLYYLTGIQEPNTALVLLGNSSGPQSILYLRERDLAQEVWVGERIGHRRAKRRYQIDEVRDIADLPKDLPQLMKGCRRLHYALGSEPTIDRRVVSLLSSSTGPRYDFPNELSDSRLILAEMRFVKDRKEIQTIEHAVDITAHGILALTQQLSGVTSEAHAARLLESNFAKLGSRRVGFPTIIASGKNATCLHHSPQMQPIWKRELLLIDAGASFGGYHGDISRTIPASGQFSEPQAAVYDVVHKALQAALVRALPDSSLEAIHIAAVRNITRGLVDLGILKGTNKDLIDKEAYKPYYMHRTGHFLGLDVHDISPVFYSENGRAVPPLLRPLEPGNVLTVEPGLYFAANDKTVAKEFRGIGVRIEEDVLITPTGHKILSSSMPTERKAIEELMA